MQKIVWLLGIVFLFWGSLSVNADELQSNFTSVGVDLSRAEFSSNVAQNTDKSLGNYHNNDVEDVSATYYARYPEEVKWTVQTQLSAATQASWWGMPSSKFLELNPQLSADTILNPGEKYVVFRKNLDKIPRSIGRSNSGKLKNPVPMLEGEGWVMRTYRPNCFGMPNMVEALAETFSKYAERFPGARPINVGDLSHRRGGRLRPHVSHRSGRDVDFGYVVNAEPNPRHPESFIRATAQNLDVEKTWFVIKTLIDTGEVQKIFMDARVQKWLIPEARKTLNEDEIKQIFGSPYHENSDKSIIRHWNGHINHAHVRFICPANSIKCKD